MQAFDRINQKWGRGTLSMASVIQKEKRWLMNQRRKSAGFTTSWSDIPVAGA